MTTMTTTLFRTGTKRIFRSFQYPAFPITTSVFHRNFSQSLAADEADTSLQSMSLLQYGEKQVYLFGVDYEGSNVNMKDMISDLQPDHILLAVCKERADKLLDTISKGDGKDKNSGNSSKFSGIQELIWSIMVLK